MAIKSQLVYHRTTRHRKNDKLAALYITKTTKSTVSNLSSSDFYLCIGLLLL